MKKVLAFGEILWDMFERDAHLGGAPLNFAAHALQCGIPSGILSCLGNDKLGNKAFEAIQQLGINTDLILRRNKKTGTVKVELKNGQPDYEIFRNVAYDYIDIGRLDHEKIAEYDFFYFGTLAQRSTSSRESLYEVFNRHSFKEVCYDVNLRKDSYTKEIIEKSMTFTSILKINDEEVKLLSALLFDTENSIESFCQAICKHHENIRLILVTAGGEGSYLYEKNIIEFFKSNPVEVVDTVGAGDAFCAAFLVNYIQNGNAKTAIELANNIGGFVATQAGAIPEYDKEIKKILGL